MIGCFHDLWKNTFKINFHLVLLKEPSTTLSISLLQLPRKRSGLTLAPISVQRLNTGMCGSWRRIESGAKNQLLRSWRFHTIGDFRHPNSTNEPCFWGTHRSKPGRSQVRRSRGRLLPPSRAEPVVFSAVFGLLPVGFSGMAHVLSDVPFPDHGTLMMGSG